MKFTELPLSEEVLAGIEKAGFTDCTLVQENVLPISLPGRDVMVQSKTGSGKTAVFLLSIFQDYIEAGKKGTALVVAPTRELAVQIEEDAKLLSSGMEGYRVGCFYGGVGYEAQTNEIREGLNLYVGTPGRLLDFAKSHKIDFREFDVVVLDEADRMFDMGFYPDIQKMFSLMRDSKDRQTMLFSATLSTKVRNLAWQYMNDPKEIEVQPEEITVKNITQELFHVTKEEKFGLLLSILKKENPESCLIFSNTKDKCVEVSKRLNMNGYKTEYLMGDMAQSKRLETIDRMKEGKLHFLVATDVAARGLQIDDLQLVVNYDIPEDFENYVHRIGRTARAGKTGKAITLACEEYIYGLEAIETYIQMKVPVLWADEEGLEPVEDKSEGYRYHRESRGGSRPSSQKRGSSSGKGRNDVRGRKPTFHEKEEKDETLDYESKTDFNKLNGLSVEERMAYYKKAYGGGEGKKPQNKKQNGGQKQ
ncbi:MAG: DEAD/DEAH box helicase, partial [Spirochaetales bacterium]|nr:DEAD/DEAH box helicase [Candidatus Physcosoma equi]